MKTVVAWVRVVVPDNLKSEAAFQNGGVWLPSHQVSPPTARVMSRDVVPPNPLFDLTPAATALYGLVAKERGVALATSSWDRMVRAGSERAEDEAGLYTGPEAGAHQDPMVLRAARRRN